MARQVKGWQCTMCLKIYKTKVGANSCEKAQTAELKKMQEEYFNRRNLEQEQNEPTP